MFNLMTGLQLEASSLEFVVIAKSDYWIGKLTTFSHECSSIRVVSKYGVGLDNIDQVSMRKHGVKLGWRRN